MKPDNAIRIDGGCDDIAVVAWFRVALGRKKCGLVHYTDKGFIVPVSEIFRNPTYTRYQIVNTNTTGPHFALADCRTQPALRWTTLLQPPTTWMGTMVVETT